MTQLELLAPNHLTKDRIIPDKQPATLRAFLLLIGIAAVLAGLYGRFTGIGIWPLGVDEFYISRSVDNVLRSGLPQFACGGYYTRGLLFQYLVAGMRLTGLGPEFAGRLLAGLCSLAALPAAYVVAKRAAGPLCGYLTVIVLCVSVWEIEMARFARMYAPFQAVFAWYVVFYLRYCVDKNNRALLWMVGLSVLGVLTWEGGVLLGVANILAVVLSHDHGRLRPADIRRVAGLSLLLAALFVATRDLRGFAEAPGVTVETDIGSNHLQLAAAWLAPLHGNSGRAAILLLPLGLLVACAPWIWSFRRRWLACAALCLTAAAASVHMFTASAGVIALMLLSGLIDWRELTAGRGRVFTMALVGFLICWSVLIYWTTVPAGAGPAPIAQQLFGFPDVYDEIIRPWGRTMPCLSVGVALAAAFWAWHTTTRREQRDPIGALLSLLVLLALAVGVTATDRLETRYTFFLYPIFIVLAIAAILRLVARRNVPLVLAATVPLVCFGATEDFQPRHIAHIASANVNFRVGMSAVRAAHYYPRNDMRAVGQWLAAHVRPGDVVLTGIPNLVQYYAGLDYFFLEEDDPRYDAYVCQDRKTERWTGHTVLYGERALEPVVSTGHRLYVIVYRDVEERLQTAARKSGWSVARVWAAEYGGSHVLLIAANSGIT